MKPFWTLVECFVLSGIGASASMYWLIPLVLPEYAGNAYVGMLIFSSMLGGTLYGSLRRIVKRLEDEMRRHEYTMEDKLLVERELDRSENLREELEKRVSDLTFEVDYARASGGRDVYV